MAKPEVCLHECLRILSLLAQMPLRGSIHNSPELKLAIKSRCMFAAQNVILCGQKAVCVAGSDVDELKVKEETSATLRCIPFEQPESVNSTCFMSGNAAKEVAIFAKSY